MRRSLIACAAAAFAACGPAEAASEMELLFWRKADRTNLASDYSDYLRRFPGGDFVNFARNRIAAAEGETRRPVSVAPLEGAGGDPAAAEAALGLGTAERMALQEGLVARGYEVGPITGAFDARTREALRAWQLRSGERATGYLTERQYDELTTAPLSGALPADGPMTHRLDLAASDAEREAREAALGYGPEELAELEARLDRLGFDPGPQDGALDAAARAAIRAYRLSRGFEPHGWLDRSMVDQLFRDTASWLGPRTASR